MKLSIIGTGFISKNFLLQCKYNTDIEISNILTRRNIKTISDFPYHSKLTNSISDIINSDIVFECSGSPKWANRIISYITKESNIPVVTMNSEFHITYGSNYSHNNITESRGDQPGSFIDLNNEIVEMGFDPIIYLNIKRYTDLNPSYTKAEYWANKLGISPEMVIASLDETKIQIEQCLIANHFNVDLPLAGMTGHIFDNDAELKNAYKLNCENQLRIVDFTKSLWLPKGVAIIANHESEQNNNLKYFGLEGPPYLLVKPYHLCHLEVFKSLRQTFKNNEKLLTNGSNPKYNVYAITKRKIQKGTVIKKVIGNLDFRGVCHKVDKNLSPIGFLEDSIIVNDINENEYIKINDVEQP